MAAWHFYFFAKIFLHAAGRLRVEPVWNALLLAAAAAPLPKSRARWSGAKSALCWCAAIALFWRESWLPPFSEIVWFLTDKSVRPSPSYVIDFLLRAASWRLAAAALGLTGAVAWANRRRLNLNFVVAAGLAVVFATDPLGFRGSNAGSDFDAFHESESRRRVVFGPAAKPDFDVILIHVCSLSWEDMRAAGLENDPFWKSFHLLFTNFHSATAYSNPAALRLLRAPCGQMSHEALFRPADDDCYLMEQLRRAGYQTWAASDHDGGYDHFADVIRAEARVNEPMSLDGVPVYKRNFDESPIYDPEAALEKWRKQRQASGAARAALYFNAVSLHQGTHPVDSHFNWSHDRDVPYRTNARDFFARIDRFFAILQSSGRRAVVILVAEHGAALLGTRLQAPDMRDIPSPRMISVPAAVRFFGPEYRSVSAGPRIVDASISYLALAELIKRWLGRPPYGADVSSWLQSADNLPETAPVGENQTARTINTTRGWMVQQGSGPWRPLPLEEVSALNKQP